MRLLDALARHAVAVAGAEPGAIVVHFARIAPIAGIRQLSAFVSSRTFLRGPVMNGIVANAIIPAVVARAVIVTNVSIAGSARVAKHAAHHQSDKHTTKGEKVHCLEI